MSCLFNYTSKQIERAFPKGPHEDKITDPMLSIPLKFSPLQIL